MMYTCQEAKEYEVNEYEQDEKQVELGFTDRDGDGTPVDTP